MGFPSSRLVAVGLALGCGRLVASCGLPSCGGGPQIRKAIRLTSGTESYWAQHPPLVAAVFDVTFARAGIPLAQELS